MTANAAGAPHKNKFQVLVIEDDMHIGRLVEANLNRAGFTCRIERSAACGMLAFEQMSPHLVLLDLGLPDANGYEVCVKLRQKSSVPIIMITGRDQSSDQLNGFKVGADDYITKPFEVSLLMARVAAQLRRAYKYDASDTVSTANWITCDGCGYMGPREKFEEMNSQGFVVHKCPNCSTGVSHLVG
ncbi:response regulator transcription factor [bacterium]|nr:MAG: response regulator transcription factor [bacterium]